MKKKNEEFCQIQASSTGVESASTTTEKAFLRPDNYASKAKYCWSDYSADSAFGYLVDRMSHYAVNGTRWHLKTQDIKQKERERNFWNTWAARINKGMIDVLPGLDNIEIWIMKNLCVTGMAPTQWEWDNLVIDKVTYKVPVNLTLYPSSNVTLENGDGKFGKNKAYVTESGEKKELQRDTNNKGSFILKLNCSPADMAVSGKSFVTTESSLSNVKSTLYPEPPFFRAHEDVATRLKLRESDLDTVSEMLDQLTKVSVGDENHQPKPPVVDEDGEVKDKGTIEEVKDSLELSTKTGATRTLYLPYYVNIDRDSPDMAALLNYDKYMASTVNLLTAFGIIVSPGRDTRLNLTDINTQNFEQYIEFIRKYHLARFIEGVLCADIVEKNKGKLTEVPSLRFNLINTKTKEFRTQIYNMLKLGRMSTRMALESYNLNKDHVTSDLKEEFNPEEVNDMTENELFNRNVPTSYKQEAVNPDGSSVISDRDVNEGGRPAEQGGDTEEE